MIIDRFIGETPILENHLLQANGASLALNALYYSGAINSVPGSVTMDGAADPKFNQIDPLTSSIYHYDDGDDDYLFQFQQTGVNVVNNPLANDAHKRAYWNGPTGLKYGKKSASDGMTQSTGTEIFPTNSFSLGVPGPIDAPAYTITDLADTSGGMETTALTYTFVTALGEESQPSPPTTGFDAYNDTRVSVVAPTVPGGYQGTPITKYRVYMLSGGFYLFLAERPIGENLTEFDGGTEVGYVLDQTLLGEAIATIDYDPPPANARGLISLSGGYLAGFFGNTICFSEPYLPYAWPKKYYLPLPVEIVGLVSTSQGVLVGTTGKPYLLVGSSPFAMNAMELDTVLPCVQSQSMVDMGEFALYASHDGLVMLQGGSAQLVTSATFSTKQWRDLNPSSIRAVRYEDYYLAFTGTGQVFAFDPRSRTVTFLDLGVTAKAMTSSPKYGVMVLGTDDVLYQLAEDHNNLLEYTWQSRRYVPEPNQVYAWGKVEFTGICQFTFQFFDENGVSLNQDYVISPVPNVAFRLPSKKAAFVGFKVSGEGKVTRVSIGASVAELHYG